MKGPATALLLAITLSVGCHRRYNEMVEWCDKIQIGTPIVSVQRSQPAFVDIGWRNPIALGKDTVGYELSANSGDPLKMSNMLVFVDGGFIGRWARK